MKKSKLLFVVFIAVLNLGSNAQNYITIPDAHFAAWLNAHIPSAMNGNQMDTSNVAVATLTSIDIENNSITDLTGVQYFHFLITLDCGNSPYNLPNPNILTSLPTLPVSLDTLICGNDSLISLPALPDSLILLKCYGNKLTNLPTLPNPLKYLDCGHNQLTNLSVLPNSLQYLDCSHNQLTNLPALSNSLQYLDCSYNQLTNLPFLPASIYTLFCGDNQIANLPTLPNSIMILGCRSNQLTSLPVLPSLLQSLDCDSNQLANLPALPNSITVLYCYSNLLTNLPALPNSLTLLHCIDNQLTFLPVLSNSITTLLCDYNQLSSLPALPASLQILTCSYNQLTNLPVLPESLSSLECFNNNIYCFPPFPNTLVNSGHLYIIPNPFVCLPNYVAAMDSATLAYPLCIVGDTLNNPHGCSVLQEIVGFTYKDNNTNCTKDSGDLDMPNISMKSYDANNNLLNQTYSAINGIYNFADTIGTYIVKVDTANIPFTAQCVYPGIDSVVTLSNISPVVNNVNFAIGCKTGFDVGVQSVVATGWVFPGQQHILNIIAGDISQWYHLNCASGVGGQVQITVTGPVTFNGIVQGSLTPLILGNVFTYSIADFDTINNLLDFGLQFITDTMAQSGEQICVSVNVSPFIGDNNTSNNSYQYCYFIENSHDPNMKEVYPINVLPGYNDWLTYTIHFQNTGTAAAANIRLTDTLDNNLNLGTFQVINYSHKNIVSVQGNLLTFNFSNIMLPDSASDPSGSQGYVQYRIKPKANLQAGSQIKNTAYIYFDYNSAIVTNTAVTDVMITTSSENITENLLKVYPNPGSGKYNIELPNELAGMEINIKIYSIYGCLVTNAKSYNTTLIIDLNQQPNGVYILNVSDLKGNFFSRSIIKE